MDTVFNLEGLSERENLIAQLVACVALEGENTNLFKDTLAKLRLTVDADQINETLSDLEKKMAEDDSDLSDLLANASKSTCCS